MGVSEDIGDKEKEEERWRKKNYGKRKKAGNVTERKAEEGKALEIWDRDWKEKQGR